ncbi:hypothetical protein Tco_0011890 [Tanacetum coccineum]
MSTNILLSSHPNGNGVGGGKVGSLHLPYPPKAKEFDFSRRTIIGERLGFEKDEVAILVKRREAHCVRASIVRAKLGTGKDEQRGKDFLIELDLPIEGTT